MTQIPTGTEPSPQKRRSGKLEAVEEDRDELVRATLPCPTCGRPPGARCNYGLAAVGTRTAAVAKHPVVNPVHLCRYLDAINAGLVPPLPAMTTLSAVARSAY